MRVRVILHGGDSYAWPTESDTYPSLKNALNDWSDMRDNHRTRDGLYAPLWGDVTYPDRDDNGYATVGYAWPYSDDDPIGEYPHWQLLLGPKGGLKWEIVG